MPGNGTRPKTDSEFTMFQKKIASMDNVILCVAEVERMVSGIGHDMMQEPPCPERPASRRRAKKPPWADRRNLFKKR